MLFILACLVTGCGESGANETDSYQAYVSGLDRSCVSDGDCVVKDVGNCCGYNPECVNATAQVDKEKVALWCKKTGMASICGFPSIESCRCQNHLCVNVEPAESIQ